MNLSRVLVLLTEVLCIAALALCGLTAFKSSAMFGGLQSVIEKVSETASSQLDLIILCLLLIIGVITVIWRNQNADILGTIVLILALPAILSFSDIDLFKVAGANISIPNTLSFAAVLSIGVLILAVYGILDMTALLKKEGKSMIQSGASDSDISHMLQNNHFLVYIGIGSTILFTMVVSIISRALEILVNKNLVTFTWWIIPAAFSGIFIIGIYFYWLTTRKISS